jgi:DNA-binding beta-propeller fold protein YncE
MGDVGNDLQIYGSKLYVVLNASHKVDVLDLLTAKKITQIDIPNCRFIRFHEGKAYVSSYAGPIAPGSNATLGAVYKIDTITFITETEVTVGYQPEEMEIIGKYLFVANSGGYMPPKYDNTVSVIDLGEFKQIRKIPVGINLHRIRADKYGKLWVSSMGNREKIPSMLFVLEKQGASRNYAVTDSLDIPCSNFAIRGDSLFLFSVKSDFQTGKNQTAYGIINVKTKQLISENFISDGTGKEIEIPYGLALHPENGDIFITDAKNYVSSGELHCYDKAGKRKWSVRTGDIPAHIAFVNKKINNRR